MKINFNKLFKLILLLIILSFLGLYFVYSNGYYERLQNDKTNLTNQMIEKFETDLKEGKDVRIEEYIQQDKNYETRTSKITLNISNKLENIVNNGIKFIFRRISNIVE